MKSKLSAGRVQRAPGRRSATARAFSWLLAAVAGVALRGDSSMAQGVGVRISGTSTSRYVQLRPLVADSVPESEVSSRPGFERLLDDGTVARCVGDGFCRFFRSGDVTQLMALMQDLDATAWGFGRGASVHAEVRFRESFGDGRSLWPQARQHLDVLALYAELDRERVRARLGRQWFASELGFRNFDGALVDLQPLASMRSIRLEGYAGWSLLQGLARDLTSDALATIEAIPPDSRGILVGGTMRWRPPEGRGAFRAQYEREIRQDRAGLYAERASAAGDLRLGRTRLSSEIVYDFSTAQVNEARLRARHSLSRGVDLSLEGRHSTPFFPLWTIWGVFSPVGFDEGLLGVRWTSPGARLMLSGNGAYRQYRETNTGVASLPLRTDGWRFGTVAAARLSDAWLVQGSYGIDIGTTASRSDGDISLRWLRSDRFSLAARGSGFQTISEWRVGTGRVWGAGMDMTVALRPELRLAGNAMWYRQQSEGRALDGPWNQRRATVRLEWTVGADPGAQARGGDK